MLHYLILPVCLDPCPTKDIAYADYDVVLPAPVRYWNIFNKCTVIISSVLYCIFGGKIREVELIENTPSLIKCIKNLFCFRNSWQECSKFCRSTAGCKHWTYRTGKYFKHIFDKYCAQDSLSLRPTEYCRSSRNTTLYITVLELSGASIKLHTKITS